MPRHEQVIVVLVASPSDLEPERNQLEDVVRTSQSPQGLARSTIGRLDRVPDDCLGRLTGTWGTEWKPAQFADFFAGGERHYRPFSCRFSVSA